MTNLSTEKTQSTFKITDYTAGFLGYLRFIIRRERIISSIWIGLTVIFTFLIALMFPSLLGDEASKIAMIEMLKSPSMVGMLGPVFDTQNYTVGMAFSNMMTIWVMITIAVMNIFFVNRHTRMDEENGQLEVLRSLPVGKLTNPTATICGAVILNLVIAILTIFSLSIAGLEGYSLAGAIAYSLQIAVFGLVMAAITLLCAQIFSTSLGSSGAAFAVLGIFYMLRLGGDYTDGAVSYISPMGLGLRVYAFCENNFLPIIILLILAVAITCAALVICARRDLGEGLISAKKGRADAKKSLLSPFGLALRLTKNAAIIWCLVIFVVAAMYGTMFDGLESFVESNDFFKQFLQLDGDFASSLTDSYVAMLFLVMAHIAVIPSITFACKIRSEESHGRLEQVIARAVKRRDILFSFTAIALATSIATSICTILGLYVTGYKFVSFSVLISAGLCYIPAMWVFAALSIFLTGFLPRGGIITWVIYAYSFLTLYMGKILSLPEFLSKLSPFGLVPTLPTQDFSALPVVLMILVAGALIAAGAWRFENRDIAA